MAVLWKKVQHSWKGGLFDQALMGRSDLAKYPESASVLENFIVKRQGCISKRRGTDELADLKNLLGGTIQPSKVKLIPLVYEKDEGYYVLMTFDSAPAFPAELERLFNINNSILRSLTIRVEE